MKKFILKLDLHDNKDKRKALKTVSTLAGIDSISMDMKGQKLTVVGSVDPVTVVSKLRKFWPTEMILVGPAKEPEKKEDPKKEGGKKEEGKPEEGKKEEGKKEEPKKDEQKKDEAKKEDAKKAEPMISMMPNRPYYPYMMNGMPYPPINAMPMPYRPYYPPPSTYYYPNHSVEENPNGCVIC